MLEYIIGAIGVVAISFGIFTVFQTKIEMPLLTCAFLILGICFVWASYLYHKGAIFADVVMNISVALAWALIGLQKWVDLKHNAA